MPSGGYGLDEEDGIKIREAMTDPVVKQSGLQYEWLWAYASARGRGASPAEAACAAYGEWDL